MPVIPALRKLKGGGSKSQPRLHMEILSLKKKKHKRIEGWRGGSNDRAPS
jgi:hypothetical protein